MKVMPQDPKMTKKQVKECPYLKTACQEALCPGWLHAPVDDCIFHVCLTGVKYTFREAAVYLDRVLDLPEGDGRAMLEGLKGAITGSGSPKVATALTALGILAENLLGKAAVLPVGELVDKAKKSIDLLSNIIGDVFEDE